MSFSTTFGADYLTLNPEIVFGTAMLGRQFGVIKRASLKRSGIREEVINDAGELKLVLIKNPGFELLLECAFERTISAPGLFEEIELPFVGVKGYVMEGASILWESGSERTLSIPVNSWDTLINPTAYRLEVTSGLRIDIGRPGNAPVTAPVLTTIAVTGGSVSLSISFVAGADRYRTEWSSDGVTWTLLALGAERTVIDEEIGSLETRRYRARGQEGEAAGPWSAVLIVTTTGAGIAPTAAPVITITDQGTSSKYTWPAVANAESYEAQWRANNTDDWQLLAYTTPRFVHLTGRVPNDNREVRVRAQNTHGQGPWATVSSTFWPLPTLAVSSVSRTPANWKVTFLPTLPSAGSPLMELQWSTNAAFSSPQIARNWAGPESYRPGDSLEIVPILPAFAADTLIYFRARLHLDFSRHYTEFGPVVAARSIPRTPVNIVYDRTAISGTASLLRWSSAGGTVDGWRIYRQTGTGTLRLMHIVAFEGTTIPAATTGIDTLDAFNTEIVSGDKIYVVAVRGGVESQLPTPVIYVP